jgi:uncharacterized protein
VSAISKISASGKTKPMTSVLRLSLRIYKVTLSSWLTTLTGGPGTGCRFEPTCSEYFVGAVETHGFFAGSLLGLKRLAKCHPWGGCGYDPVPPSRPPLAEQSHH